MNDEWQMDDTLVPDRHDTIREPHLRIGIRDGEGRLGVYISKPAMAALGMPSYVQIMFSTAGGHYRIKLVPTVKTATARPIRVSNRSKYHMGGGASMVKRHKFPKGYYLLEDGVFVWRFA